MSIPAATSFRFDSAQYCGRTARIGTSAALTASKRASTPSCRASSRANSSHVQCPELTQWYKPGGTFASRSRRVACAASTTVGRRHGAILNTRTLAAGTHRVQNDRHAAFAGRPSGAVPKALDPQHVGARGVGGKPLAEQLDGIHAAGIGGIVSE